MSKRIISYDKLWKLLVDKKMSKADLRRAADMSSNTLTKMRHREKISMDVLLRICNYLDADISEVCEFIKEEPGDVK